MSHAVLPQCGRAFKPQKKARPEVSHFNRCSMSEESPACCQDTAKQKKAPSCMSTCCHETDQTCCSEQAGTIGLPITMPFWVATEPPLTASEGLKELLRHRQKRSTPHRLATMKPAPAMPIIFHSTRPSSSTHSTCEASSACPLPPRSRRCLPSKRFTFPL